MTMNDTLHCILIVAICSLVTIALRLIPFIIFPDGKKIPRIVSRLSNLFPGAVIGMLIIFCLKDVSVSTFPFGLPELIAVLFTGFLHIAFKNTLLSVLLGTVSYMLLVQLVFI